MTLMVLAQTREDDGTRLSPVSRISCLMAHKPHFGECDSHRPSELTAFDGVPLASLLLTK